MYYALKRIIYIILTEEKPELDLSQEFSSMEQTHTYHRQTHTYDTQTHTKLVKPDCFLRYVKKKEDFETSQLYKNGNLLTRTIDRTIDRIHKRT